MDIGTRIHLCSGRMDKVTRIHLGSGRMDTGTYRIPSGSGRMDSGTRLLSGLGRMSQVLEYFQVQVGWIQIL